MNGVCIHERARMYERDKDFRLELEQFEESYTYTHVHHILEDWRRKHCGGVA